LTTSVKKYKKKPKPKPKTITLFSIFGSSRPPCRIFVFFPPQPGLLPFSSRTQDPPPHQIFRFFSPARSLASPSPAGLPSPHTAKLAITAQTTRLLLQKQRPADPLPSVSSFSKSDGASLCSSIVSLHRSQSRPSSLLPTAFIISINSRQPHLEKPTPVAAPPGSLLTSPQPTELPPFQQIFFLFGLLHSNRTAAASHLFVSFNQRRRPVNCSLSPPQLQQPQMTAAPDLLPEQTITQKRSRTDLKTREEKIKINCHLLCLCVFVLLQVTVGVTTGREGESRADPPISGTDSSGAWVHAPPVTVACWNTRRQLFLPPNPVQKGSLAISGVLRTVL